MAEIPDITVKISPSIQALIEIKLEIYESLLKLLYDSSNFKYDGLPGELEFDVNKFIDNVTTKITELQKELEKYNTKTTEETEST